MVTGMKISIIEIGKTDSDYLRKGIEHYNSLTGRMVKLEINTLADVKKRGSLTQNEQKRIEGEKIISQLRPGDFMILLDERGTGYDSIAFASYLESLMSRSLKRVVFVIGGPYGFSDEVYTAAAAKVSLSPMTFSHQLVRLLFAEQLFRALTLIRGIPYHNA
jgi:23S rRNA (pseudouridine1915-N3)-methyltransferase